MTKADIFKEDWIMTAYDDELYVGKVLNITNKTLLVQFLDETSLSPTKLSKTDKQKVNEKLAICKVKVQEVEGNFLIDDKSWAEAEKMGKAYINTFMKQQ